MASFLDAIAGLTRPSSGPAQNAGLFGANSALGNVGGQVPGSAQAGMANLLNLLGGLGGTPSTKGLFTVNGGGPNPLGSLSQIAASNGSSDPFSGAPQQPTGSDPTAPAAAASAAAPAPPSLQEILQAILGPSPAAPTSADLGAAPTLSQFYNAAPYTQAQSQLASNSKTATGSINADYTQAANQLAQIIQQGNAASSANQAASNADMANTTKQVQGYVNSALGDSGTTSMNTAVGQALTPMLADLAASEGRAKTLNDQMATQGQQDNTAMAGNLTSARQNALNYLASQVSGEGNKISLAQAAAQAQGNQALDSANNARSVAATTDAKNYESELASRQTQSTDLLKSAMSALSGGNTNRATALNALQSAPTKVQNLFNGVVFGGYQQAGTPAVGTPGKPGYVPAAPQSTAGAAKDGAEAVQRLQDSLASAGLPPDQAEQLQQLVLQYYNSAKPQPSSQDLASYLQNLVG